MAIDPYSAQVAGQYLGIPTDDQMSPAGGDTAPLSPDVIASLKSTMASSAPAPVSPLPEENAVGASLLSPPTLPTAAPKPAAPKWDFDTSFNKIIQGESGGSGGAVNSSTKASGLFQIMPDQAAQLGLTPEQIQTMPAEQQKRELFPKYLALHNLKPEDIKSDADMALAIAAPSFVGKGAADDKVVYGAGSKEAKANPAWQTSSGDVTVGSLKSYYKADDGATAGQSPRPTGASTPTGGAYAALLGGGRGTAEKTTISTATHEGVPYTSEDQTALGDIAKNAITANENASLQVQAEYAKQRADILAQQEKAQQSADAAEARKFASQQYYNESKNKIAEAQKAVDDDQAPKPFGGNVFASILATIGMALGAYGASITHSKNFAADLVQQQLDRDLKGWEQKHLDLKFKVQNARDLSRDQWQEYQTDRAEHAQLQNQVVLRQLDIRQNGLQNAEEVRRLGLVKSAIEERSATQDLELQRLSRDRAQTTITTEREPGKGYDLGEVAKQDEAARTAGVPLAERESIRKARGLQERLPLTEKQQAQAQAIEKDPRLEHITQAQTALAPILELVRKSPKGQEIPGTGLIEGSNAIQWPGVGEVAHMFLGGNGLGGTKKADLDEVRANQAAIARVTNLINVGRTSVGIERSTKALDALGGALAKFHRPEELRSFIEEANKALAENKKEIIRTKTDDEAVLRHFDENSFDPEKDALPQGAVKVSP